VYVVVPSVKYVAKLASDDVEKLTGPLKVVIPPRVVLLENTGPNIVVVPVMLVPVALENILPNVPDSALKIFVKKLLVVAFTNVTFGFVA
jgi:hypothetical protein